MKTGDPVLRQEALNRHRTESAPSRANPFAELKKQENGPALRED